MCCSPCWNAYQEGFLMDTKLEEEPVEWSEIILLTFVYALYVFIVTAPIGFVISGLKVLKFKQLAKRGGSGISEEIVLTATHHEWLVRTFIGMVFLSMVALGTIYYIYGFAIAAAAIVWWFYRLIRGGSALIAHREVPAAICTKARCFGQVSPV